MIETELGRITHDYWYENEVYFRCRLGGDPANDSEVFLDGHWRKSASNRVILQRAA